MVVVVLVVVLIGWGGALCASLPSMLLPLVHDRSINTAYTAARQPCSSPVGRFSMSLWRESNHAKHSLTARCWTAALERYLVSPRYSYSVWDWNREHFDREVL